MVSIDSIDTWSEITMTEVQFQLYHGGQALLVGKPEFPEPEKPSDLSQVTDKLYHNML